MKAQEIHLPAMVVSPFRGLGSIVLDFRNANSPPEPIPSWAANLIVPTFAAVAVLTMLPPPGPTRVIVGLTAFTSLWFYVLTHWVASPAFFMNAIFMISITARWMLLVLCGTPEIDYYQTSQTGTKLQDSGPWHQQLPNKVRWSVELWSCWRGQGWNYVDEHLPKGAEQNQSRLYVFPC